MDNWNTTISRYHYLTSRSFGSGFIYIPRTKRYIGDSRLRGNDYEGGNDRTRVFQYFFGFLNMKKITFFLVGITSLLCGVISPVHAEFAFGLHTEMNSTKNLRLLEEKYHFTSPIIGYIFDTFHTGDATYLRNSISTMGTGRVYHVSISPFGLSAAEVAQ